MDNRAKLVEVFRQLLGNTAQVFFPAKVVSVSDNTCTIEYDGLQVSDVRLAPTTTAQGGRIILRPAKDSDVMVASYSGSLSNLVVIAIDTVESFEIKIGDISIVADKDGIVFNGGTLGGMVKLENILQKINTLEDQVNTLRSVISAWQPVLNDGGTALKTALATSGWLTDTITPTQKAELENTKIKQ